MLGLTVLSPHRDDAVFSLALALSRWSKSVLPITVLNFFTVSNYAPHSSASSVSEISYVRAREDRHALSLLGTRIRREALGLLDAPLRLGIKAESISDPQNDSCLAPGEIDRLMRQMQPHIASRLVLAPLALGNHIDHRVVCSAALQSQSGRRLGFYEDLPYATWTSEEQLAQRVAETEISTRIPLKPVLISSPAGVLRKLRLVSLYLSQITRQEAKTIALHARRYGGCERIWIPRRGNYWSLLP